jgi:hypothetical protein
MPKIDTTTLAAKAAERERKRQQILALRTEKQRLEAIGTLGGWVLVLFIAVGVAALASGLVWWAAIEVWKAALSSM